MGARSIASRGRAAWPTWLIRAVYFIAALAELLAMLLMTVYRYRAQGMSPGFLELTKTGNLFGLLLTASFVLLFAVMAASARGRRLGAATAAVALSSAGLVLLSSAPLVPLANRNLVLFSYLVFKAIEWSILVTTIGRPRRPMRAVVRVVGATLATVVGGFILVVVMVLLRPVSSAVVDEPRQVFDAGVILGAAVWSGDRPSPVFRERIRKGYDLLRSGTVQNLVLTGSNAPHELPEAEVARRELLKLGADPTRIVSETHTHTTVQQILFVREQLLKQGWRTFLIISDQFHLTRALEICDFNGIQALGVSSESPLGPQNLALYHVRESFALVLYWLYGV